MEIVNKCILGVAALVLVGVMAGGLGTGIAGIITKNAHLALPGVGTAIGVPSLALLAAVIKCAKECCKCDVEEMRHKEHKQYTQ